MLINWNIKEIEMKKINKFFVAFSALLLILTSLLSVAPAFAEEERTTETVTLHKILQTETNLKNSAFPGTKRARWN